MRAHVNAEDNQLKGVFSSLWFSHRSRLGQKLQFFQVTTKCQAETSQSQVLMFCFFSDLQPLSHGSVWEETIFHKHTVKFLTHFSLDPGKKTIIVCTSFKIKTKYFDSQKCLSSASFPLVQILGILTTFRWSIFIVVFIFIRNIPQKSLDECRANPYSPN